MFIKNLTIDFDFDNASLHCSQFEFTWSFCRRKKSEVHRSVTVSQFTTSEAEG